MVWISRPGAPGSDAQLRHRLVHGEAVAARRLAPCLSVGCLKKYSRGVVIFSWLELYSNKRNCCKLNLKQRGAPVATPTPWFGQVIASN